MAASQCFRKSISKCQNEHTLYKVGPDPDPQKKHTLDL